MDPISYQARPSTSLAGTSAASSGQLPSLPITQALSSINNAPIDQAPTLATKATATPPFRMTADRLTKAQRSSADQGRANRSQTATISIQGRPIRSSRDFLRLISPKYRGAKQALKRFIDGPRKSTDLTESQTSHVCTEITKLDRQSNVEQFPSIIDYIECDTYSINKSLREGNLGPSHIKQFLEDFDQLEPYDGAAYRTAYITKSGAACLLNGKGKIFLDQGVQSASTQPFNAFEWKSWAKDNVTESAVQQIHFVFDDTVPKKNLSYSALLMDHVAIPPGTPLKLLAAKMRQEESQNESKQLLDDVLYVYMTSPTKTPDRVFDLFSGEKIY